MSQPIWQKQQGGTVDADVQTYLAGHDVILDRQLFVFDIQASRAHARGLAAIKLLSDAELQQIETALTALNQQFLDGQFELAPPMEDGHSAIEAFLTSTIGETGKKIHTGRSRNDQVQVAMRLYLRDRLDRLGDLLSAIADALLSRAEVDGGLVMPGYTHLQRAVPSTVGLWLGGLAEAFIDLVALTRSTRDWINTNPLGTAAGYGVNLPLARDLTTQELAFDRVQLNPMYVQNSRGRFELQALNSLAQATLELRRLAWDLSLYTSSEFAFVQLPPTLQTGSSIMPNKRNPDLIELLRAQHAVVQGATSELQSVLGLPSGYQRDLQATKEPVLRAFEHTLPALALVPKLIQSLAFDKTAMAAAIDSDMFATDVAIEAAVDGVAFRTAYQQAMSDDGMAQRSAAESVKQRVSPGACGNLQLEVLRERFRAQQA